MFLYLWADLRSFDLVERLREGALFSLAEILDFVSVAGRFMDDILDELSANAVLMGAQDRRVQSTSTAQLERRNRLATA